jgi:hypothetical protein
LLEQHRHVTALVVAGSQVELSIPIHVGHCDVAWGLAADWQGLTCTESNPAAADCPPTIRDADRIVANSKVGGRTPGAFAWVTYREKLAASADFSFFLATKVPRS